MRHLIIFSEEPFYFCEWVEQHIWRSLINGIDLNITMTPPLENDPQALVALRAHIRLVPPQVLITFLGKDRLAALQEAPPEPHAELTVAGIYRRELVLERGEEVLPGMRAGDENLLLFDTSMPNDQVLKWFQARVLEAVQH